MLPLPVHWIAIGVFFKKDEFLEVFIWGLGIFFLVLVIFIMQRFLRNMIGSKVRSRPYTIGMTIADLEKMRDEGQLTEEELRKVKQRLSRKILEHAQEEERKKAQAKANQALKEAGLPTDENPPSASKEPPKPPRQFVPDTDTKTGLPPHLAHLLDKPEVELQELEAAGFLTPDDVKRVREARR